LKNKTENLLNHNIGNKITNMGEFTGEIKGVAGSSHAKGAIYAMLAGMVLGNALPSPSDAWYFHLQTKLRDKWKRGEISAEKYWKLNAFYYYAIPMLYWLLVGSIIVSIKGDAQKKIKLTAVLIGGGVVVGVILKQMQKDKTQLSKEEEECLLLMKNHPEVVEILKRPEYKNISSHILNTTDGANGESEVKYPKLSMDFK